MAEDQSVKMSYYKDGSVVYKDAEGKFHRTDGPAVIWADGGLEWWNHGKPHRDDGPAMTEDDDSYQLWYLNGELHRTDGPASVNKNGMKDWSLLGTSLLIAEFKDARTINEQNELSIRFRSAKDNLDPVLVKRVMRDKGFTTLMEFCNWLAFDVLGEESVPVINALIDQGGSLTPVMSEYFADLEAYATMPFSWWYPIVESEVGCR